MEKLSSRTETRAKLTRYHSDFPNSPIKGRGHFVDDGYHPVLITKNNSGLLTDVSARGSEMIFDPFHLPAHTDPGSLKMFPDLLVLFIAFSHCRG
jgi:hypothetical protein